MKAWTMGGGEQGARGDAPGDHLDVALEETTFHGLIDVATIVEGPHAGRPGDVEVGEDAGFGDVEGLHLVAHAGQGGEDDDGCVRGHIPRARRRGAPRGRPTRGGRSSLP